MKMFALFIFSLLVFFAAGFAIARLSPRFSLFVKTSIRQENILDCGFRPTNYPIEKRPFVIVIIGRNNGAVVEKTIQSAFFQNYENFRIIYIDDASSDGSFDLARDLIYDSNHLSQVTLVKNEEKLGHVVNLMRAVQACEDKEIVVVLNGEDRLAHEWVLERLNHYYTDPDLWLTYGQYLEYPSFKLGKSRPYLESEWNEKGFRGSFFPSFHLKTFYASLFKRIHEADLFYQGTSDSEDHIYMIPLLEMACDHFQFLPEILYLSLSNLKELQPKIEMHLRSQSAYAPLPVLSFDSPEKEGELQ